MAITFVEAYHGDDFSVTDGYDPSATIPWIAAIAAEDVANGITEAEVLDAAVADSSPIPETIVIGGNLSAPGFLTLKNVEVVEVVHCYNYYASPYNGIPDGWRLLAHYEYMASDYEGDTTGGQQHITSSIATMGHYPENVADLHGTIGFDGEQIHGCDIIVPQYQFSETYSWTDTTFTPAYKTVLYQTTGKVNSDAFRDYQPGEVLFLGAQFRRVANNLWEVRYHFQVSPNKTDLVIGSIGGIVKKGWEYLWVQYEDDVDNNAHVMIRKPRAVYVEKVYETAEFVTLGINPV